MKLKQFFMLAAVLALAFTACPQPTDSDTKPTVVNIADILGVTPPVTGEIPVTAIAGTAQYTGTVTWSPTVAPGGTFAASTTYTATIALAAKSGYTFTGVAANSFNVAGATSVNNAASSGTVTATFPTTDGGGGPTPTVVNEAAITGVTQPVTGATPATAITNTAQYTGSITWNGSPATFAASTTYTATISLTAASGYTFTGLGTSFFTVANATPVTTTVNSATSATVTAVFPATGAAPTPSLALEPNPVTFADVAFGYAQPAAQTVTIRNNGAVSATVSGIALGGAQAADFALNGHNSISAIAAGGSETFTVQPNAGLSAAIYSATITATYNGGATAIANVSFTVNLAVASVAAIPGVTAPATGATPVAAIADTTQYTGTVAWNGNPGTFAPSTAYTATITLTAKTGYTFTGLGTSFFTVAGATPVTTTINSATSATVTATFPATAAANAPSLSLTPNPVPFTAVFGYVQPPAAETVTISNTGTGAATVSNIVLGGAQGGYFTLNGTSSISAIAAGTSATFTVQPNTGLGANTYSATITVTYDGGATASADVSFTVSPAPISIPAIPGVTPPVVGETPVTAITETTQYTGTVAWSPTVAAGGTFAPGTPYTANITLTPKTNYTLAGVAANYFTVSGTSSPATNTANSGIISATFPATASVPVTIAAIPGVTPPVTGEQPVTAIETPQYTGIVEWSHAMAPDGTFAPGTPYTATITLTSRTGYFFTGLGNTFFSVAGATPVTTTITSANTATVTAPFPATAAVVVNIAAIPGVTQPVTGAIRVAEIIDTAQYTGTVVWSPSVAVGGTFAAGISYIANITLSPKSGYTFTGVAGNFFTVANATSFSNAANSNTVSATFPATDSVPVTISAIQGVTAPVTAAPPVAAITETAQYTGTVAWSPSVAAGGTFAPETSYTAIISLTAKQGFSFTTLGTSFFTVAGAAPVTTSVNGATSATVSAVFPATAHVHQWGAWSTVTAATYIAPGVERRVCALDPTHIETQPIPQLIIDNTTKWNTAIGQIQGLSSVGAKSHSLIIGGNVTVTPLIAAPTASTGFGTVTDLTVTLTGSGTLNITANGSMFWLGSGQTLVIDGAGLTLQGRIVTPYPPNYAIITVPTGATLELKNGTLTGNSSSSTSGAGGVTVSGGTFSMTGGSISGNEGSACGGVYVGPGSFTMSGGTIAANKATTQVSSGNAGGVFINGIDSGSGTGSFSKSGGTIYGNTGDANANTLPNNVISGYAVRYRSSQGTYNRDTTLGTGDNISTANTGAGSGWGQ